MGTKVEARKFLREVARWMLLVERATRIEVKSEVATCIPDIPHAGHINSESVVPIVRLGY